MGKAVYLPPVEGRVNAFVPANMDADYSGLETEKIPLRVLTESGGEPGVLVFPPGSEAVRLALLPEDVGIEDALNSVLVDFTEIADEVKSVVELNQVIVEVSGRKSGSGFSRVNNSLGSLPISISGSVLAQVLGKPVRFIQEDESGRSLVGFFEVHEPVGGESDG
jgi:hypothetical protein